MKYIKLNIAIPILLLLSNAMASTLIENGKEDSEGIYSNVHKISFSTQTGAKTHCTGTIISDYSILSAGHCFAYFSDDKALTLNIGKEKIHIERINIPTKFWKDQLQYINITNEINYLMFRRQEMTSTEFDKLKKLLNSKASELFLRVAKSDISIITTKNKINKNLKRTKVSFSAVKINTDTISAGYGSTDFHDHTQTYIFPDVLNFIESIVTWDKNYLAVVGSESGAPVTTSGDSGGPLLLVGSSEQIGVLSGVEKIGSKKQSIYASMKELKNFIQAHTKH